MAAGFPWLPIGSTLAQGAVSGRLVDSGPGWQLCATADASRLALLLRRTEPAWRQAELDALAQATPLLPVQDQPDLACLLAKQRDRPMPVSALALRNPALSGAELDPLVAALSALRTRRPDAGWDTALFLPEFAFALGVEDHASEDRRATLLAALSGGARDPGLTPERVADLNPRLDAAQVAAALRTLELDRTKPLRAAPAPDGFELPGQPRLQALLREQVLDLLHRRAEYARLGVPPPAGVLLAGPPGCGKSFAAARLAAFLGWPLHEIRLSSVGTAFLHETSRRLSDSFDRAAREAPAVILLEELDAIAQSRAGAHSAAVEEVNTLLRLVEQAPERGLFVLGTTNRLDAIDPALRRRGRFDHVLVMDYPDEAAVADMLRFLLRDRPQAEGMDLAGVARRLARHPASDVAWVVNEAARLAVRGNRPAIDELLLARAVQALSAPGQASAPTLVP